MARPGWMTALALALALVAAPVFGQGNSATLSGVVSDRDGGLVPGATVQVTNVATGEKLPIQVTNASGAYSFPGLVPGTYKVTITLQGFKTSETDMRLNAGSANSLSTKLDVGQVEEVVNVTASSDLVRTETPTVSQTVGADFIQTLPRADRSALYFLIFLPGVTSVGSARSGTTFAGLPDDQTNITIDGVSTSNLLQTSDGYFSMVVPRLDAVEEVTLTTASAGADASGQGAIQIRFVTRSGTNRFETSVYEFMQHAKFNTNTYFNRLNGLPVPAATSHTYGGRIGGPIVLPGFDGRGRAFFFFNQEEVYGPAERARSRTFIRQSALDGNYCYGVVGAPTCVNVMTLAAANGQLSSYDPQVKSVLELIRAAAATTGTISEIVTDPNTAGYDYLVPTKSIRHTPTVNITVNLTPKHRLQGSYYWQRFNNTPDTLNSADATFPGLPAFGDQSSYRTTASMSLRSTLSTSIVNEVRGGWQWSPVGFFMNATAAMFENQGGADLRLGFQLTNAAPSRANGLSERNTPLYTLSDQFNWLKGSHAMTFGADYTHLVDWQTSITNVQRMDLGFETNFDPAEVMFTSTNFPGSSSSNRSEAKALYGLLTGRLRSISGTGYLNNAGDEYIYNGPLYRKETQDDYSFFAQDVWRWKPTVTITMGLRYQYTLPMSSENGVFTTITTTDACGPSGFGSGPGGRFCNMFNPGVYNNPTVPEPTYIQYGSNTKGYNTDLNNVGPIIGIAWRPNVQSGWLRTLLGDPELATINGGWTRSFVRTRMDMFLNVYNGNPGQYTPASRSTSSSTFDIVNPGESWPILYREKNRHGAPAFNPSPAFPIAASSNIASNGICISCGSAWLFDPDIEVPWTDSWNVSFQRSLTKDTVVEIRYQGNRSYGAWGGENWNANNVYETGWLNGEFENAQANLHANVVAGRGPSIAYMGSGTGTVPLPIMLAHLNASTDVNNASAYAGGVWTSSSLTGYLDPYFPNPSSFASTLYGSTFSSSLMASGVSRRLFENAIAVGYPTNYWRLNPQLSGVNVYTNSDNEPYNHLFILQLRRRLSAGLTAQVGYTWSRNVTGSFQDYHLPRLYVDNTRVPHAIQALWSYDIPVGRGKRYGANMSAWLDAVAGGWNFAGTARFQTQAFFIRDAVLVGMTFAEAQKELSVIRFVTDPLTGVTTVFNFPEDIYTQTRLAYSTDETQPTYYAPGTEPSGRYFAPAGGPSCNFIYTDDCGVPTLRFMGRWFGEMDFSLSKSFQLPGRARFEFRAEVFNATMAKNFPNEIDPGTSSSSFRMTGTQSGARTAQLVWRVSW